MTKQIRDQLMDFDGNLASPSERERAVLALAEAIPEWAELDEVDLHVATDQLAFLDANPEAKAAILDWLLASERGPGGSRAYIDYDPADPSPDTAPSELRTAATSVNEHIDAMRGVYAHRLGCECGGTDDGVHSCRSLLAANDRLRAALRGQPETPIEGTRDAAPGLREALEHHRHHDNGAGIVTCRCGWSGIGWNSHFLAAIATPPSEAPSGGLDPERLARAIWTVYPFPGSKPAQADIDRIAAEYNRLSPTPGQGDSE